jgi:hypothetical protein
MEDKIISEVEPFTKKIVQVFFKFCEIGKICDMKEVFDATVIVEAKWQVNETIWEAEYSPETHWNPQLIIENAVEVKENIVYEFTREPYGRFITEIREVSGKLRLKFSTDCN